MGFLLGFIALILFFGLFIFLIILGFFRSIFRLGRKRDGNSRSEEESFNNKNSKRGKVFQKNEGEYVDYEEVKD